jgi:hypothetical protein
MPDPVFWMKGYYQTYRALMGPLAFWPFTDEEKADPQREELERLCWQRLYDSEIKKRLAWIERE